MSSREPAQAAHPAPTRRLPGDEGPLSAGEMVVLIDRKKRRYLVTLEAGAAFHSHAGLLAHDELIGRSEGFTVRTNRNMELIALRPTRDDYVLKMKRGAQVVYPKDQAMIIASADIRPGCTVVEAGGGSGALTLALLDAVGSQGTVISIEQREDHAAIARANVERFHAGCPPNWNLIVDDAAVVLPTLSAHRVVLDLLDPWTLAAGAGDALRVGGILVAYTPGVPQVMRLTDALHDDGRYTAVSTLETLLRPWHVEGLAVRPAHRMVAHTAFLTTARRVPRREDGGPPPPRHRQLGSTSLPWGMVAGDDDGMV